MRRLRDTDAVSPIIGFIIATVVFSVSFYYVVDSAVKSDPKRDDAIEYTASAQALADLVMSKGRNWYTGSACTGGELNEAAWSPEKVGELQAGAVAGQFGLGNENCGRSITDPSSRNNLSYEKFSNLYQALYASTATNGRVDYEEARRSLGLTGRNLDFHIRSWPVMESTVRLLSEGFKDPYMRAMYIGNYDTGGTRTLSVAPTPTVNDLGDRVELTLGITNNGQQNAAFEVSYKVLSKKSWTHEIHTPLIAANGGYYAVTFTIYKVSGWEWKKVAEPWVTFTISDRDGSVWDSGDGTAKFVLPVDMTSASTRPNLLISSGALGCNLSGGCSTMSARWSAFEGDGDAVTPASGLWTVRIIKPDGSTLFATYEPTGSSGSHSFTFTETGAYTLELRSDDLATLYETDVILVVNSPLGAYYTGPAGVVQPSYSTEVETRFMDALIQQFDRYVYDEDYEYDDPAGTENDILYLEGTPANECDQITPPDPCVYDVGDVFPADKQELKDWVPLYLTPGGVASLDYYTVLIVGSDVDQTVMNSGATKDAVEAWVKKGGTLVALGSGGQHSNWLQPFLHSNLVTASTGLYAPDPEHPILNVPNPLDYQTFTQTSEWENADGFTDVVETQNGNNLLSVSNPGGAVGDGKVILTGWRPSLLTPTGAADCTDLSVSTNCDGLFFIHNLITISYRELYLDYGPELPIGEPNGVQLRVGSVYHPELKALLPVEMQIFVFPGSG